jgi:hypothetical protein
VNSGHPIGFGRGAHECFHALHAGAHSFLFAEVHALLCVARISEVSTGAATAAGSLLYTKLKKL